MLSQHGDLVQPVRGSESVHGCSPHVYPQLNFSLLAWKYNAQLVLAVDVNSPAGFCPQMGVPCGEIAGLESV